MPAGSTTPNTLDLERYSKPSIFFHWAIVVLIALAYFAIEIRGPGKGLAARDGEEAGGHFQLRATGETQHPIMQARG